MKELITVQFYIDVITNPCMNSGLANFCLLVYDAPVAFIVYIFGMRDYDVFIEMYHVYTILMYIGILMRFLLQKIVEISVAPGFAIAQSVLT